MLKTIRRLRRNNRGQTTVEFLISAVFVFVLVFWVFELIMLLYTYSVMAGAAKIGVRYAVVHGCGKNSATCSGLCPTACGDTAGGNVVTEVKKYAAYSFHDLTGISIVVSYPDSSADAPSRVRVVINYPYKPYFTLGWKPPTINAASEGRIQN